MTPFQKGAKQLAGSTAPYCNAVGLYAPLRRIAAIPHAVSFSALVRTRKTIVPFLIRSIHHKNFIILSILLYLKTACKNELIALIISM